MDQLLRDIQSQSSYSKYEKWGLYNWGMFDTIRSSIPNELMYAYYDWRTKIRRVIIDIKFNAPGLARFQVLRCRNYWS
jgi:hypothetical protein